MPNRVQRTMEATDREATSQIAIETGPAQDSGRG